MYCSCIVLYYATWWMHYVLCMPPGGCWFLHTTLTFYAQAILWLYIYVKPNRFCKTRLLLQQQKTVTLYMLAALGIQLPKCTGEDYYKVDELAQTTGPSFRMVTDTTMPC